MTLPTVKARLSDSNYRKIIYLNSRQTAINIGNAAICLAVRWKVKLQDIRKDLPHICEAGLHSFCWSD